MNVKALFYALSAITLYSIANVLLERRLAKISPLASTTCIYVGLLVLSMPLMALRNKLNLNLTMPETNQFWLLAACGVLFFLADLMYFNAYRVGGTLEQIAIATVFYPFIATAIKTLSGGNTPTRSDVASWVLAGLAVVLAVKQPIK